MITSNCNNIHVCNIVILTSIIFFNSHSAGIGRTGAFCALTIAIERVKAEGLVNVYQTVKHLRTQRPHMVQTLVSY